MAKRRKKRHTGRVILILLIVIGVGIYAGRDVIKQKVAGIIAKQLIESQLESKINVNGQQVDVSEIVDNMDEADVQAVTEIAEKYVSSESISDCLEMVQDGNVSGLKQYANENLTEEDKQELQNLYEKYKDQIPVQ